MATLALRIGDETQLLALRAGTYEYPTGTIPNIADALGRTVLFFRSHDGRDRVVAKARLSRLRPRDLHRHISIAELSKVAVIAPGIETQVLQGIDSNWVTLEEAVSIVRRWPRIGQFGEEHQAEYDALGTAPLLRLHRDVAGAYGFRCALSSRQFSRTDPHLTVVPIASTGSDEPRAINLMLPVASIFAGYFTAGHIALESDYAILVNAAKVPEAIRAEINSDHRLYLPSRFEDRPSQQAIELGRGRFTGDL